MNNKSEKQFIKLLMASYAAGLERGRGGNVDFSDYWLSKKDLINEYFLEVTIEVINEIKNEFSGKSICTEENE